MNQDFLCFHSLKLKKRNLHLFLYFTYLFYRNTMNEILKDAVSDSPLLFEFMILLYFEIEFIFCIICSTRKEKKVSLRH